VVAQGRFDWGVIFVAVLESAERPPALTGTVEERGTDQPTVRDVDLADQLAALTAADPAFTEAGLWARAEGIFTALHAAWAAQDLRPVRPYVSDALANYLQYWVDAYRAQGLANAVLGARITGWEVARVIRDRRYDAVTARIWATGHDGTTEKATGRVVGGSRQRERPYSEYWTFIRGAAVRGAPRTEATCPSCAAPLAITMAGHCDHCGVHVTSGEFDWVLSRIEQDDSYTG
jgi:predicted lipid-binding transport protein (Tim44 family)